MTYNMSSDPHTSQGLKSQIWNGGMQEQQKTRNNLQQWIFKCIFQKNYSTATAGTRKQPSSDHLVTNLHTLKPLSMYTVTKKKKSHTLLLDHL